MEKDTSRFLATLNSFGSRSQATVALVRLIEEDGAGDHSSFARDMYNAAYCCVAVCRHAYRWGTIPVVKVAQAETMLGFPPELDIPWAFFQRHFGLSADSGNNTSNVLLNFDSSGHRVYQINPGMSELIQSWEDVFFRMFLDVEVKAYPLYYHMVCAIVKFDAGDKKACLAHVRLVSEGLRELLLTFYNNLRGNRVARSVWLSYIQGFQAWGIGRMVDGQFVRYDGLSGNHVLVFQAVDAFLGMERYLSDEDMDRYIPVNQRDFALSLKKHTPRHRLRDTDAADVAIRDEMTAIVKRMKSYLEVPAPERLMMTAGKSVLESDEVQGFEEAYAKLDEQMGTRLKETK
ncbi:hypothetical protein F5Y17DRAFT_456843 [Xylariaceae sp. FL0594]|nr:hypothetical protein F5Y17DRAFT_456843 [Xylariaceae sp. FL0594]